jgi:hypothetical protein
MCIGPCKSKKTGEGGGSPNEIQKENNEKEVEKKRWGIM